MPLMSLSSHADHLLEYVSTSVFVSSKLHHIKQKTTHQMTTLTFVKLNNLCILTGSISILCFLDVIFVSIVLCMYVVYVYVFYFYCAMHSYVCKWMYNNVLLLNSNKQNTQKKLCVLIFKLRMKHLRMYLWWKSQRTFSFFTLIP